MPARIGTATPAHLPLVSVVVAARDAAGTLAECLASLRAIDYPAVEIIVVDDGSRDATAAIAGGAGVLVVPGRGAGPSAARNQAVRLARGELVAFTDADCIVPPGWLSALVAGLLETGSAGAGGGQRNVVAGAVTRASGLDAFFRAASVVADYARREARRRDVPHIASCNAVYRRAVLIESGGFREGLFPGEDVELDYRLRRAGHRLVFVPGADVDHSRPDSLAWFARWMRRYGRSQRQIVRLHGRFRTIHYVPMAMMTGLAAQLLWLWPRARPVVVILDGLAVAAALAIIARSGPPRAWPAVARYTAIALVEWHRGYFSSR